MQRLSSQHKYFTVQGRRLLNELGKPKYFDLDLYLSAVEQMICADEIKFALTMLENLPGYYRDNYPKRASNIKELIYQQCMTTQDYVNDRSELIEMSEKLHNCPVGEMWKLPHFSPRGELIMNIVKELNSEGYCARIVELGPYNYWLPMGLQAQNCDFIYTPMSVNPHVKNPYKTKVASEKPIKDIFICFEVIEHLWNEDEVFHYFCKTQTDPDIVLISTPKYTCGGGLPNWDTRQLGHIRTWTPKELTLFCEKHWPELEWYFVDSAMMICIGKKE